MKTMKWKISTIGIAAILLISGVVVTAAKQAGNCCNAGEQTQYAIAQVTNGLTDQEIQGLQYMREEEKLARDVYLTLYEKWNNGNIFYNIAQSEQKHMDSIKKLLDKYGIDDPAEGNDVGVFTNQELQVLFNQLVAEGDQSLIDALTVGGKIEELDMIDLNKYIGLTDKSDIKQVYSNLLDGSENHLRAFVKTLKNQGVTYEPFYLSQQEFNNIIDYVKVNI
jgi:hypothetical protein